MNNHRETESSSFDIRRLVVVVAHARRRRANPRVRARVHLVSRTIARRARDARVRRIRGCARDEPTRRAREAPRRASATRRRRRRRRRDVALALVVVVDVDGARDGAHGGGKVGSARGVATSRPSTPRRALGRRIDRRVRTRRDTRGAKIKERYRRPRRRRRSRPRDATASARRVALGVLSSSSERTRRTRLRRSPSIRRLSDAGAGVGDDRIVRIRRRRVGAKNGGRVGVPRDVASRLSLDARESRVRVSPPRARSRPTRRLGRHHRRVRSFL